MIEFLILSLFWKDFEYKRVLFTCELSKKDAVSSSYEGKDIYFCKTTRILVFHNTGTNGISMEIITSQRSCTHKIWDTSWIECYLSRREWELSRDEKMRRHSGYYGATSYSVYPSQFIIAESATRWWGIIGSGRSSYSNHPISVARCGSRIAGACSQLSMSQ